MTTVTTVTTKNVRVSPAVASAAAPAGPRLATGTAARELDLKRAEFELAVQLGHIRTVPDPGGGHRRVTAREVARLRAAADFPEGLRERVRTVGTAEGAELLGIAPGRFTRLARAGRFSPVRCYLNRYRAVVWLYLADELVELALREPELLGGRHPEPDRGKDWRPRNWRARRIAMLARGTDDQWELAAAVAATLDSAHLAHIVPDPYERAHVRRLRPETFRVHPESPTAQGVVEALVLADEPDEIDWYRLRLVEALADARDQCPAPGAAVDAGSAPTYQRGQAPQEHPAVREPSLRRGGALVQRRLLGRLRRAGQPGRGGR
ncbi:hypothetical protein GCM10010331_22040 [Streptomyces xanthochromogenes]|uniref:DUF6397 family protein n=1 Tax=Streptomyces xanthochromogenes TaxID=67384 RepID=UPI0019A02F73|nr:DUF6397 family protein [Streptomyces xanthochromogenes]GHB34111.1 hypothetical protein GCM10010331_22040 [Streptomyces xanthochromogenes]